ncbi:MAG: hypothetical protein JRJ12_10690 [Deltaproteobacteria bacterium]|nr:hypothetical protein [Deltaproteobacteria bacterium]MBW2071831.1 hypothetical protein [Deltaproteobacteria bacterium]
MLQNQTAEIGIESIFTNAIIDQFVRSNRLAIKSPAKADAVLTGSISRIRSEIASRRSPEETLTTRIYITLDLTLRKRESGEVLWHDDSLSYFAEYGEADNVQLTRGARRLAIIKIANFLAEKVHENIFLTF